MPITFNTPAALADWLPDVPVHAEGDRAWLSMPGARAISQLSESGFDKLRRRLGNRYEHRDASGRIWFYGPYWLRLWALDRSEA
jgi:hypothetical protein